MTGSVAPPGRQRLAGPPLAAEDAWQRLLRVRTAHDATESGLHWDGRWRWAQGASEQAQHLAELYVPLCLAGDRHACAQLGQSLDGGIATRTGDAVYVTGEEDRQHLHRLRALADAVVVGVDTVRTDDPRLTVRACAGTNPVRVVLDHRGRVDVRRHVFTDAAAPTLWILGCADSDTAHRLRGNGTSDDVDVVWLPCTEDGFAPARLLDTLAERGLGRVLVEGGGVTVSRFLAAGALHRLYLTMAPLIIGDGVPGLRFPGATRMREALRAPLRRFVLGEDTLFELDLRSVGAAAPAQHEHDGTGQDAQERQDTEQHGDGQTGRGA